MELPVVVGIDPGLAATGFGFIQQDSAGTIHTVDYGVISTPAGMPLSFRLLSLYQAFNSLIERYRPQSAAVEKLFFQRNVKTAMSVGQARGVILLVLAQYEIEVVEYTPLEIKQAVSGYGGADKGQMQQMVSLILQLGEIPQPDDAADALAAAICHLHSRRIQQMMIDQ